MELDADQVEYYDRNGYLVIDSGIPEAVIDGVVRDLEDVYSGPRREELPHQDEGRLQDAWRISENVRRLALEPQILSALEQLYGRKPLAFQTLNFPVGTEQRPHADSIHFNSDPPGFMCGVWVALEAMERDNGTLVFYPTSHKISEVTYKTLGFELETRSNLNLSQVVRLGLRKFGLIRSLPSLKNDDAYLLYENHIEKLIERHSLEPCYAEIKKGQALIWASNLFHGGSPRRDPKRTRHSQVTHYFFEGCRYYTPMLSNSKSTYWRDPDWVR